MARLRYVVLRHEGIADPHFDLMFETSPGSALRTWRSPVWPILEPTHLVELGDHRRSYLEYEGPVSDNRGQVRRVCGGSFNVVSMDRTKWRIVIDETESELWIAQSSGAWLVSRPPKVGSRRRKRRGGESN